MKTSFLVLLVIASSLTIAAPAASAASFKSCGSFKMDGGGKAKYQAKGISCRKAKSVLRGAGMTLCFDNQISGWKKQWRALPNGGKALTLKKSAKAIKTNACSPR
jgi:hypothetical protein